MVAFVKCQQCGQGFRPVRASATFCSAKCRAAANREKSTGKSVLEPLTQSKPSTAADHTGHQIYPHTHVRLEDGTLKPCSGRFFCETDAEWFSAPPCHGEVPLRGLQP